MNARCLRSAIGRYGSTFNRDEMLSPKWNRHPVEAGVQTYNIKGISRSPLRD